jgi:hypothetical protein
MTDLERLLIVYYNQDLIITNGETSYETCIYLADIKKEHLNNSRPVYRTKGTDKLINNEKEGPFLKAEGMMKHF